MILYHYSNKDFNGWIKPDNLKASIKEALRQYKGITINKIGSKYFKEIFY